MSVSKYTNIQKEMEECKQNLQKIRIEIQDKDEQMSRLLIDCIRIQRKMGSSKSEIYSWMKRVLRGKSVYNADEFIIPLFEMEELI
ncbi:hypothetical protein [Candidatus Nitrosocosmicus sp. SS]|jgi:peptidoglycan hydrolase CwlO-like protein|uniref:hypothetical protein n=1 Tax=Candidatus Nitrosocosmicus agrestis TaxID=2563600 RepID=UPI00122E5BB3|nr:hypothetical protein [Candidatus Nitrosocosmicus sp. SS]KAA2282179.1 hypothetical protein F1Z66_07040 [Candidatus Nitrosocosmicus sp. SS]KAF0869975.1 hypothetical protein E5N71_01770 [Candidatus Nitrosocosmicus sp. SS]